MVNCIEPDPYNDGERMWQLRAISRRFFAPYILKTEDYGKTWKKIVSGIKEEHFTRVVRADPYRKGLLYAGTENRYVYFI